MTPQISLRLVLILLWGIASSPRLIAARPLGIDVSHWQGNITWPSVAAAGISFAWAKATEGTDYQDPYFIGNQNNGKAAGVLMGAYHYARYDLNTGTAGATAEANYFWSIARNYIQGDGKTLMPMLDVEASPAGYTPAALAAWINQWCQTVVANASAAGLTVKPVIYVSACHANYFDSSVAQWIPWIANYNGQDPQTGTPWSVCSGYNIWGTWVAWQYTSTGSIPGISGNVDHDVFNGTPATLVSTLVIVGDSDSDGMPDAWERLWFGGLGEPANGDYDLDGVSNLAEYLAGTNPTDGPPTVVVPIAKGVDDAEESAGGIMNLTSTDLELVHDDATGAGDQIVGVRFHVPVPPGAIITSANIQFTANETNSESTLLSISVEAADYAERFDSNKLSGRILAGTSVLWQPAPWLTVGESNALQRTPDLTPLVQAIVSRPGWVKDNAMAFLFTGSGHRTADSYEQAGGTPARLMLTYKMPAPLLTNIVSIAGSDKDVEQAANGTMSFTSTDLELVRDEGTGAGDQTIGLRFENLQLSVGAQILGANIQFSTDETNSELTTLTLHAHRSGNAAAFTTNANDLTTRPLTLNSVVWTPPPWNILGERGAAQRTPDLAALVGEVVARPSWASGNALVFIISGVGKRVAESFDKPGGIPATLTIAYHARPIAGGFAESLAAAGLSNTNGPIAAPEADFDADGWNNLLEHALGMNPKLPDPPSFHFAVQGGLLLYTYTRPRVVSDVGYDVEWSDNLTPGSWSSASVTQQIIADNGTNLTVQAALPAGAAGNRFVRLKITAK
jgi:GH25 family lysozyme M1 (1,4-beta-N-acetylmuramidase)